MPANQHVPTPVGALSVWQPATLVLLLILAGSAVRLIVAATFGLGNGEAYYFSCSRHADLSYFDHPPMHAWLARLATDLAGVHPVVLRAPFILFFAATTWLLFALGRRLFGAWAGFFAALLMNLSPVFSVTTATFLQPDSPLMFFWLAAVAILARLLFDKAPPRHATLWWLAVGAAVGLAMLCKYHAVFLIFGTVIFVASRRDQRHWLLHPGPYLAVALAFLSFAPVLVWNARHEWISFFWQGGRAAEYGGLRWDWLARSVGGQALWLLPWIWVPLVWELAVCFRRGPADPKRWFVACTAAPPILFFTITALYAPYGFHFHWQAPGYLLLFLPLGATVARLWERRPVPKFTRRWLWGSAAASLLAFAGFASHTLNGWCIDLLPGETGRRFAEVDPTLEALDYTPLKDELTRRGLLARDDVFVFTSKWYLSGKVDYALGGSKDVLCLSWDDPRAFAFFDGQDRYLGKTGVLVSHPRFSEGVEKVYANHFDKITYLGTVEVRRGKRTAVTLKLFLAENFRATVQQPYGNSRVFATATRTAMRP
jgi:hypothetical protein